MANIFLSYRFTVEDPNELESYLGRAINILENNNHKVFCSFFLEDFFQKNNFNSEQMYDYCLKKQESADTLLAIVRSSDKSKGMDLEFDKAMEISQRCILAIKEDLDFKKYRKNAHNIIQYKTMDDLYNNLKKI